MKPSVRFFPLALGIVSVLSLLLLISPWSPSTQPGGFSLALDLDRSEGDQAVSSLDVYPDQVVPIQIFGSDIQGASSLSIRFEYDSTQVVYEGFDAGDVLLDAQVVVEQDSTSVRVGIASLSGSTVNAGLMGTVRFRTTDAFSETEIRLVGAELGRGEQTGVVTLSLSIALQVAAPPSPDFDGSGLVNFSDFVVLAGAFGYRKNQEQYEAKYDLNSDGEVGFDDFEIFAGSFGARVNRAPVFTAPSPVTRSSAENTPAGEPVGDPISARDADGNTLTYSLRGADADSFAIDAGTGQIKTQGTYDFEAQSSYSVIVRVSDGEGGRTSVVVGIAVTDVDEPPVAVPPGVVVTPGDSALTVRWHAVSDEVGKPPVSGYEVAHRRGDSGEWGGGQTLKSRMDTSLTLRGLANEQTYQVRVRTLNEEGASGWSAPVSSKTAGSKEKGADEQVVILDALLKNVAEIAAPGVPGPLCVYGPEAYSVIVGAVDGKTAKVLAPVVAAGRWQAGRVVALGHGGYFDRATLNEADTGRLMTNALYWAAGRRSGRPRIGVVGTAGLLTYMTVAGHDAVKAVLTPKSLKGVDVVALKMWNQSASEREALSAFVRGGGGLVTAATGWSWAQLHPDLNLVNDYVGNRLLAPVGIQWSEDCLDRTSPRGYAVDGPPPELTHAGTALDAVEAHATGRRLTPSEIDQALDNLVRTTRHLPPDDTLLAPRLRALSADRWPSAKQPVDKTDMGVRLATTFFVDEQRRTPPESVRAHPAAADFPGSVPADALRVTRRLTIDTSVPRWHSTGLYAAPGELITVTVAPAAAARSGGFHVRVGAHSDAIWGRPEWTRMPEISRRFPVTASKTLVANAFGGLIYVEVPTDAGRRNITVEIEGAVEAPLFVLGETDLGTWRNAIRHAPAPWAEIAGRNMIVTTDVREVRGLDDPAAVAETWDRVLDLSAELAAWPARARTSPERFVVDRQISAGWMHAGYPLMAHLYHQAKLVNAQHLRSPVGSEEMDSNWGFFHEVGHNHQNYDWTFDGTGEVTVNLFTLYIYEFLCGIPVAENSFRGSAVWRAEQMARYDFDNPDFEQWKRDPFLALVMYVQLQQAFGWDAYKQVFATYRALPKAERPQSDDEKRDQWLVRFSRQVGRNLGPFFEAWGVPTSQAARASIADLPVWMPPDFP